jgi:hypothetical protein
LQVHPAPQVPHASPDVPRFQLAVAFPSHRKASVKALDVVAAHDDAVHV